MKIKKLNIVKRAVPVLISAIAVSALYTSHSFAGTNTIPWSDVMLGDSLSIGAGYYEDDTVIQIPTKQQVIERHEINIDDLVEYDDTLEGISSLTASYYSSGNNDSLGVGITSSSGTKEVVLSTSGAYTLDLGINESITLPTGYYANPITINNGVANRGSNSLANYITPTNTAFPDGYYPTSKLNEIYNAGVLNGNVTGFKGATVTYHLVHQHVDKNGNVQSGDYVTSGSGGCYTREVATWVKSGYMDSWTEWTGNDSGSGHEDYIEHHEWHDTSHYEYKWYCTCGYAYHAEEPSTTDYDSILPTQLIKSVSVELF